MAPRGFRLILTLDAGPIADTIALEPAHLERFFRAAGYAAIREGLLGTAEQALGRVAPGRVRARHDDVLCLDAIGVELLDTADRIRARVEFPRRALAVFALRRAAHRMAEARVTGDQVVRYALHAVPCDDPPFPVALPLLPTRSLADLTASATAVGRPDGEWIGTVISLPAARGLEALAELSRTSGVEAAARIAAEVGWDPERRCFVRVLGELIVAGDTRADALSVVSTAGSWREFVVRAPGDGPVAITSVHTHLHLGGVAGDGAPAGTLLAEGGGLSAEGDACISLEDMVTHYVAFPDLLSAAAIVSVFADRREIHLYGYTPGAELRLEPGYWTRAA